MTADVRSLLGFADADTDADEDADSAAGSVVSVWIADGAGEWSLSRGLVTNVTTEPRERAVDDAVVCVRNVDWETLRPLLPDGTERDGERRLTVQTREFGELSQSVVLDADPRRYPSREANDWGIGAPCVVAHYRIAGDPGRPESALHDPIRAELAECGVDADRLPVGRVAVAVADRRATVTRNPTRTDDGPDAADADLTPADALDRHAGWIVDLLEASASDVRIVFRWERDGDAVRETPLDTSAASAVPLAETIEAVERGEGVDAGVRVVTGDGAVTHYARPDPPSADVTHLVVEVSEGNTPLDWWRTTLD